MYSSFLRSLAALTAVLILIGAPVVLLSVDPAHAQVTPLDEEEDIAPGLGDITGSPEAGPEPEDAGDRGGLAQLVLAVVIFGAIAFIVSRIALATRSSSADVG